MFTVCKCTNRNVTLPCFGEQRITLMDDPDGYYCANLACNLTVSPEKLLDWKQVFAEFWFQKLLTLGPETPETPKSGSGNSRNFEFLFQKLRILVPEIPDSGSGNSEFWFRKLRILVPEIPDSGAF